MQCQVSLEPFGEIASPPPKSHLPDLLAPYQRSIGNTGPEVEESLAKLATTPCVVTGQQVGFATGPAYTVYKAATAVRLARETDTVPIFWAATEDHDVAEVASTTIVNERGDLQKFKIDLPHGHFVEDLPMTDQAWETLQRFFETLDLSLPIPRYPRYAQTMIALLAHLFQGTGLLFVEPSLFRATSRSFFSRELSDASRFRTLLQEEDGPLTIADHTTRLFYKTEEGRRVRISQHSDGFLFGDEEISQTDALARVYDTPDRFSPDVAARPLYQCQALPVAAYVGGPSELAYHFQLQSYFIAHELEMPPLIKRMSVTFAPPEPTTPQERHSAANLRFPKGKPQERLLNYWMFHPQESFCNLLACRGEDLP